MSGTPPDGSGPRSDWVGWLERRLNLTELFSFFSAFGLIYTRIDTRRPLRETLRDLARQGVASYTRGRHALGALTVILFGLQAVTGVLLAFYYRPTPEAAFESTRTIVRDLPVGWFIHQMHAWGAYLLGAVVLLRLFQLFWIGLYRAPRELLWWTGVVIVWAVLMAAFTGRLLTWDTQSYWGTVRGLEVLYALPGAGPILAFLFGGHVVNQDVLLRFYVLHVLLLPVGFLALLYLTFATVREVGLGDAPSPSLPRVTTLRDHGFSMLILTVIMFGVLVTLAVLVPMRFTAVADPYATPTGIHPPWYLLASYALMERAPSPSWLVGLFYLAVAAGLLALPFWAGEPGDERPLRRARWIGALVLVAWIALSLLGATLDRR